MRYPYGVRVQVPYTDTEGMKNIALLIFDEDVDRRRVMREVRKFIKSNFRIPVTKEWLQKVPVYIPLKEFVPASDEAIEAWLERITYHEDEDESNPSGEGSTAGEAEEPLQTVQGSFKPSSR